MPNTLEELASMIAKRDGISYSEAMAAVNDAENDIQHAFYEGKLDLAEDVLHYDLGLEPDYLMLFIN